MLQLKEFPLDASTDEINNFLSSVENANIIQTKPYVIQYEMREVFEQPTYELKGTSSEFIIIFENYNRFTDRFVFKSGHIILFNSRVVFMTKNGQIEIDFDDNIVYINGVKHKDIFNCICFEGIYRNYEIYPHSKMLFNLVNALEEINIITTSITSLYHQRTKAVILVGQMQANATLKVAEATNNIAREIKVAGQLNAVSTLASSRERGEIEMKKVKKLK